MQCVMADCAKRKQVLPRRGDPQQFVSGKEWVRRFRLERGDPCVDGGNAVPAAVLSPSLVFDVADGKVEGGAQRLAVTGVFFVGVPGNAQMRRLVPLFERQHKQFGGMGCPFRRRLPKSP